MNGRRLALFIALVIFPGCRQSPPLQELPTSHLSTDLQAEAQKPPEQRHHLAWLGGVTSAQSSNGRATLPDAGPLNVRAEQVHMQPRPSRRSLASYQSRVPEPALTVVPPVSAVGGTQPSDPWAAYRPKTSARYAADGAAY
jgi:hypothetical protein